MSNNVLGRGMMTIIDLNDIIVSNTAPVNPTVNQLWLDTSKTPHMLMRYDGTNWVKSNYESLEELDKAASDQLKDIQNNLTNLENSLVNDSFSIVEKTQSGEFKVNPDKIYSIVKQTTEYKDDEGKIVKKEELVSEINQRADEIYISAQNVKLAGGVSFTSLLHEENGKTFIDGGKIKTNSITANAIDANSISAKILSASSSYIASMFAEYANITKISAREGYIKNLQIGKLAGQEINLSAGNYEYELDSKGNKVKDEQGNYTFLLGEYYRDINNLIVFKNGNDIIGYVKVIYDQTENKYTVNHPILGIQKGATIEELKSKTGYEIFLGKDNKYYMLSSDIGTPSFIENSRVEHLKINNKGMYIFSDIGRHIKIDKNGVAIQTGIDPITGQAIYDTKLDIEGLKVRNADVIDLSADKVNAGTLNANNVTIATKAGNASVDTLKIDGQGIKVLGTGDNKKAIKIDQYGLYLTDDYTSVNPTYRPILTIKEETINGQARTGLIVTDADIVNVNASKITTGTLDANNVTISGGDVTINSNGISINGNKSSINLNNKFIVNSQGVLTATEGNIANWNITENKIYSESQIGYIELDSDNKKIVLGEKEESFATPGNPQYVYTDRIILGYKDGEQVLFGQTGVGSNDKRINLLFNKQGFKIYNDTEDLFKIDIFGNANFAGTINAKGGYFSGSVAVGENGKIKIDGSTKTITVNTSDVVISESGITINKGQLNINNNFIVDADGNLTAKTGYIGSTTDGVKINNNGLEIIGNGIIKNSNTTINKDYVEITDGSNISVKLGKIGTGQYGLIGYKGTDVIFKLDRNLPELAGWGIDCDKLYKDNIEISSALSQFIIKDNNKKVITLGNDSTPSLNLYDANENKILYLDKTGLHTSNGNLHINADGTISLTGSITAASGSIGGITISSNELVTGALHITNSEQIWIGPNDTDKKILFGKYAIGKYGLKINGTNAIEINQDGITSSKFTLSTSTGDVTANDITVNSGTFSGNIILSGNLTMPNVTIGSNVISIKDDSSNEIIKIGKFTKDSQSFTGIYIKSGEIDLTNFKVDKYGNITATSGTIGGITISSNKLVAGNVELNSTGIISKVGTETVFELNSRGASFKGSVVATSGKIGDVLIENGSIKAGNVTISNNGIIATRDSSTIFSINESGATFSGTINATQGWFGTDSANSVKISNSGLVVSENGNIIVKDHNNNTIVSLNKYGLEMSSGEIRLGIDNGSYKFVANSSGVFASAGAIAGWNISSTSLSNGQVSIDSANEVINVNNKIKIGKISDSTYGFYSETDDTNGKTITTIDNNGLLIKKNDINIFSVNKDGNASFYGSIVATGGYFKNTVSVGENGKIAIDGKNKKITVDTNKVIIDETGIQINSGSISIGSKFSVNSNGDLVATSAIINGIVNAVGGYFGSDASKISIDSNGIVIGSAGIIKIGDTTKIEKDKITVNNGDVLIGKNASNEYGIFANNNKVKLTASGLVIDDTSSSIRLGSGNFEVTGAGVLTAKSGNIAGWTISTNSISKTVSTDSINIDSSNLKIETSTSSSKAIIGKYDGTNIGIYAEAKDTDNHYTKFIFDSAGLVVKHETDELFKIDKSGNASFKGTINATGGNFTGSVKVGDASSNVIIDGTNKSIKVGTSDVIIDSNGITINKGSITLGSNFSVTSSGNLTAQNATITGTINATSGYFGGSNKITINSNGIVVNDGQITLNNTVITKDKISVNSDDVVIGLYETGKYGIKAGDATLTSSGLTISGTSSNINLGNGNFVVNGQGELTALKGSIAGWTVSTDKISKEDNDKYAILDASSKTIKLGLNKYQTVSPGNVIKQAVDKIVLGQINDTEYGLYVESDPSENEYATKLKFSQSGLSIINNATIVFNVDNVGNAYFAGNIKATGGYFSGIVNVGENGNIKIDGQNKQITVNTNDVVISDTGIAINKGSINIGNGKFTVNTTGELTAQQATITGTVNATSGYFGDSANGIAVNSNGLEVKGTGKIIAGKNEILSDRINVKDNSNHTQVTIGFNGTEYGLFAGGVKLTSSGLTAQGVTIGSSGINVTGSLSINLNSKFIVASDGTITATQGTIGGWTLSSTKLSATGNSTTVDLSNSGYIEVTKANAGHVKIGYLGTTVGLLVESANGSDSKKTSMQFDDSGLAIKHDTNTLMSIDKNGNASFKGVITATGGSFTSAVNVGTGAVVINGSGSGSISAASGNVVIDANGLTIKQGSIDINNGQFKVTSTGQLTAQNATITGTVNATSGYFGSSTNKVTVDANGLVIGTGRIVDKQDNPNIQLNSEGITAKKGYIGNTVINELGLKAGGTKVTDKGIEVEGQQSVVIDDGSMIVKDEAGYNVVNIGNNNGSYGITIYGATTVNKTEGSKTANQTAEGKVFTYKVQTTNKTMLRRAKVAIKIS